MIISNGNSKLLFDRFVCVTLLCNVRTTHIYVWRHRLDLPAAWSYGTTRQNQLDNQWQCHCTRIFESHLEYRHIAGCTKNVLSRSLYGSTITFLCVNECVYWMFCFMSICYGKPMFFLILLISIPKHTYCDFVVIKTLLLCCMVKIE